MASSSARPCGAPPKKGVAMRNHLRSLLLVAVATGATATSISPATADLMFMGLGTLPDTTHSSASAVSADGEVVVGQASPPNGPNQAFIWTRVGGMVGLGDQLGVTGSAAYAVSADGSVIVGAPGFRWTQSGGIVWFGGVASGVSADGSVVVGSTNGEPFRW